MLSSKKVGAICKACYGLNYRNDPVYGPERRAKLRAYVKRYKQEHRDKVNEWQRNTKHRTQLTIVEID